MGRPRKAEIQDAWPQRARFVELLDQRVAEGVDLKDIAKALDLSSTKSLEHDWRYNRARRPGRNTMEKAAAYFGVSIWELDGPMEAGPSLDLEAQANLRAMGTDLSKLSPEQRSVAIRTWRALVDGFMRTGATLEMEVIRAPKKGTK